MSSCSNTVSELMRRMEMEVDPIAEEAFWTRGQAISSVRIFIKNGQSFDTTVEWPPGHPRRPLTASDV
ncbi:MULTISPECIES: hypothetical protein [unclassified Bradyrhizobium]|uniref:hypothetical protein n=1 Tax=unclassified Bradyrhizobium TaxID=2631580 RepID=UPI00339B58F3